MNHFLDFEAIRKATAQMRKLYARFKVPRSHYDNSLFKISEKEDPGIFQVHFGDEHKEGSFIAHFNKDGKLIKLEQVKDSYMEGLSFQSLPLNPKKRK